MGKILKILKINVLSILALPLLLFATVSKLLSRAFEKMTLLLKMFLIILMLVAAFELLQNPQSILQVVAYLVAVLLIGGLLLMLLFWVIGLLSAILAVVWSAVISFFEIIHNLCYTGYLKLSEACTADYDFLCLKGNKIANGVFCLFYSILKGINRLIVGFVTLSFVLSIVLSVGIVAGSLFYMNLQVKAVFGLNLLQFWNKFNIFSVIYGVALFVALMASIIVVLITLGLEWYEWSKVLRMTSSEYGEYITRLKENEIRLAAAENNTTEAKAYMQSLEGHIENLEALGSKIDEILSHKENPLLTRYWSEYLDNLTTVVDICSSHKNGIPYAEFKNLIPQIQGLEKQRSNIEQLMEQLKEEYRNPLKTSVYFAGCNTPEKLEKRYKSLCKAYHPDADGGDEESFKKMQAEYEQLKDKEV